MATNSQKVRSAYREVFGWEPKQEALAFYTNVLDQNPSFDMIGELKNSPGYAFYQAYQNANGYRPTRAEIVAYLDSGSNDPVQYVSQGISPFNTSQTTTTAQTASTNNQVSQASSAPPTGGSDYRSQLNDVYQQVLGRDVGNEGIGFYTPALESGQMSIDQVRDDVIKNSLNQIYQDELGRPLGQEGLNFYGPYLQSGDITLDQIRQYVRSDAPNDTGQYTPLPSGGIATIGAPITTATGQTTDTRQTNTRENQILQALTAAGIENISPDIINYANANPNLSVDEIVQAAAAANEDYQFALDRPADPGALSNYAITLLEGGDRDAERTRLVNSSENITNIDQLGELGAPGGVPLNADANLASIADLAYNLATGTNLDFPEYQVAGLTPEQQLAFSEFMQNRNVYQPYLTAGADATMQGIGAMGDALNNTQEAMQYLASVTNQGMAALGDYNYATQALGEQIPGEIEAGQAALQEGISTLRGSGDMYSPDMIAPFMSDYEDAAVQQALADIARQGELRERDLEAEAVRAGAFGGSRQAVAEQELGRNVMQQQGRTAAEMRNQGYQSAAQRSQAAFEDAMRRQQQMASQFGQLGVQGANLGLAGIQAGLGVQRQAGDLGLQSANLGLAGIQAGLGAQQQAAGIGQGLGSLGQQYANMGGQAQQYQAQDLSTLMQLGQMQQGQTQAELDAQRMNAYQQMMVPFQQLAFASDIMTQTPTGITSIMSQPIQGPSLLSQIGGLGLAALSIA